uniref:Uncharacterized protein n=1 Tax=Salmo trutta TaxID=8032 RepID=A0A674DAH9_SALTR
MQSWTCICLIICSMQSMCHCCDWIRHHYGHLSSEYLSLLDQMVSYQHTFEDQVRFRNETIYQITKLFDGNMKAVTWDKKKLDDFLNILERQLENLNSCVSNGKKKAIFQAQIAALNFDNLHQMTLLGHHVRQYMHLLFDQFHIYIQNPHFYIGV